ncbi:pyridoxal phosphate-dependent decarboxylase family protein [Saccharothrix isguenensis]
MGVAVGGEGRGAGSRSPHEPAPRDQTAVGAVCSTTSRRAWPTASAVPLCPHAHRPAARARPAVPRTRPLVARRRRARGRSLDDHQGRAALVGLDEADSVVIDPHEWLFQPYEIGCLLVRDPATLHRAFALGRFRAQAGYLDLTRPDLGEVNLSDHGVQFTTAARALKLWLSFKGFGVAAFRAAIDHGLDLAEHAAELVERSDELELLAGPSLGILCLRYRPRAADGAADLDAIQARIAETVNNGDRFMIATTGVDGRRALRLCTINPRTTPADVDSLVVDVLEAGRALE